MTLERVAGFIFGAAFMAAVVLVCELWRLWREDCE